MSTLRGGYVVDNREEEEFPNGIVRVPLCVSSLPYGHIIDVVREVGLLEGVARVRGGGPSLQDAHDVDVFLQESVLGGPRCAPGRVTVVTLGGTSVWGSTGATGGSAPPDVPPLVNADEADGSFQTGLARQVAGVLLRTQTAYSS